MLHGQSFLRLSRGLAAQLAAVTVVLFALHPAHGRLRPKPQGLGSMT